MPTGTVLPSVGQNQLKKVSLTKAQFVSPSALNIPLGFSSQSQNAMPPASSPLKASAMPMAIKTVFLIERIANVFYQRSTAPLGTLMRSSGTPSVIDEYCAPGLYRSKSSPSSSQKRRRHSM